MDAAQSMINNVNLYSKIEKKANPEFKRIDENKASEIAGSIFGEIVVDCKGDLEQIFENNRFVVTESENHLKKTRLTKRKFDNTKKVALEILKITHNLSKEEKRGLDNLKKIITSINEITCDEKAKLSDKEISNSSYGKILKEVKETRNLGQFKLKMQELARKIPSKDDGVAGKDSETVIEDDDFVIVDDVDDGDFVIVDDVDDVDFVIVDNDNVNDFVTPSSSKEIAFRSCGRSAGELDDLNLTNNQHDVGVSQEKNDRKDFDEDLRLLLQEEAEYKKREAVEKAAKEAEEKKLKEFEENGLGGESFIFKRQDRKKHFQRRVVKEEKIESQESKANAASPAFVFREEPSEGKFDASAHMLHVLRTIGQHHNVSELYSTLVNEEVSNEEPQETIGTKETVDLQKEDGLENEREPQKAPIELPPLILPNTEQVSAAKEESLEDTLKEAVNATFAGVGKAESNDDKLKLLEELLKIVQDDPAADQALIEKIENEKKAIEEEKSLDLASMLEGQNFLKW